VGSFVLALELVGVDLLHEPREGPCHLGLDLIKHI
jgi:hypothetical protein